MIWRWRFGQKQDQRDEQNNVPLAGLNDMPMIDCVSPLVELIEAVGDIYRKLWLAGRRLSSRQYLALLPS